MISSNSLVYSIFDTGRSFNVSSASTFVFLEIKSFIQAGTDSYNDIKNEFPAAIPMV